MSEPFNLLKLFKSPFTGLYWVKVIMFSVGIGFISFVGYGVYKAYFKKPPDTQKQIVHIISPQSGANINIGQDSKPVRRITPFIEIFIEGTKEFSGSAHEGKAGIRTGLHF